MPINNNSANANNASVLSIVLGTTLVVGSLSSLGWCHYFTRVIHKGGHSRKQLQQQHSDTVDDHHHTSNNNISNSNSKRLSSSDNSSLIKPPFPERLREMLSECRLAYLSTVDKAATSSHLSLMRFTYVHDPDDGEVVIMSTKRKTKKFEMLSQQNGVALLVHDFDNSNNNNHRASNNAVATEPNTTNTSRPIPNPPKPRSQRSITLNGNCRILEGGDETKYREAHLHHNPDYPQFIVGEDIAVLCIHVTSARICDLNDRVVHWNVDDMIASPGTTATTTTPAGTTPVAETARV